MTIRASILSGRASRVRRLGFAALAALSLNAFAADGDGSSGILDLQEAYRSQAASVEQEPAGLADRYSQLAATREALQGDMTILLAQAETAPAANNRGVVQLLNQVEALNGELNRLRGQMEVLSNDIANAQKRQRDMYVDLDTRLRRMEQGGAGKKDAEAISALEERIRRLEQGGATPATIPPPVTSSSAAPAAGATPPPAGATSSTPATVAPAAAATASAPAASASTSLPPATLSATDQAAIRRAYDNAYSNYRLGDFPTAIRGFESFVKSYPKHELAGNAQYWVGDSYSRMNDFRSAIEAEQRLLGTYPDSPKAADAMLIIGTSEANLRDTAAARKTFEDLIAKYPSSESADKARQRLAKLK
ncbi:MAG TPA: tol-pal system protein YbgF [Burkholderiales bacterium]|nr:tol-pal system protein YbgF [Burkholderiales bacterium]